MCIHSFKFMCMHWIQNGNITKLTWPLLVTRLHEAFFKFPRCSFFPSAKAFFSICHFWKGKINCVHKMNGRTSVFICNANSNSMKWIKKRTRWFIALLAEVEITGSKTLWCWRKRMRQLWCHLKIVVIVAHNAHNQHFQFTCFWHDQRDKLDL